MEENDDKLEKSQNSVTEMQTNDDEDQELANLVDAEEFIAEKGVGMLEYEKQMFLDVLHSDALVVCAKGMSYERVLTNLLKVYCDPGNLILVVNSTDYEEKYYKKELNTHLVYESSTNANERYFFSFNLTLESLLITFKSFQRARLLPRRHPVHINSHFGS